MRNGRARYWSQVSLTLGGISKLVDSPKRPILVTIAALIVALKAILLLMPIYIATFATPDSTFQLIGDSVRVGDVRLEILTGLILWLVLTVYVALGLWRGNSIARHAFFALLAVVLLVVVLARQRYIELPILLLAYGLVAWYLYAKPNVRRFFKAT